MFKFTYKFYVFNLLHMLQAVNVLKHQWAYSCDKARIELGYNPKSLKEGLEEILPWLKVPGEIKY